MSIRFGLRTIAITFATIATTVSCGGLTPSVTGPTSADSGSAAGRGPAPPTQPAPPASATCDATKAQFAVGERASEDLLDRARVAAGAGAARFIRPDEPITLEFLPGRLNLRLNARDVVASLYCG